MIIFAWVLMGTAYLLMLGGMIHLIYLNIRDKFYDLMFGGIVLVLIMLAFPIGLIGYMTR